MIESYGIQIMSPLLTNGSTEQDMLWALRNLSDKDWIDHSRDSVKRTINNESFLTIKMDSHFH